MVGSEINFLIKDILALLAEFLRNLMGLLGFILTTETKNPRGGNYMSEEINETQEITSEDKLWSLLAYVFSPLVPIIILLMEDKKDRPFIRSHNVQALALGVIGLILNVALGWLIVPACFGVVLWGVSIYWGFQAYQGKQVEIPVLTELVRNQGWA